MTIPWRILRCQAMCVLAGLLTTSVLAAPPGAAANGHLAAGVVALEPWVTVGKTQGLGPRLVALVSQAAGRPVEAVSLPLPRLLNALKEGSVPLAVLAATDDRDAFAERLCEVGTLSVSLATPKSGKDTRTLPDLSGKSFAVIRGSTYLALPQLDKLVPYPVATMKQGFSMLAVGRVDAAICARPGCMSALRGAAADPDSLDYLPLLAMPLMVYATKASTAPPGFEAVKAALRANCTGKEAQARFAELLAQFD